jgi:hypothetical protein
MRIWRRPNPTPENRARVLDISRATLDSEFLRANRWDEKARGQATLAGSWFAVTQAVAAVAAGSHVGKAWVVALVAGLVLQAGTLVMNLVRAANVWEPRDRLEFGRETIEALEGRMSEPAADVATALLGGPSVRCVTWVSTPLWPTNVEVSWNARPWSGSTVTIVNTSGPAQIAVVSLVTRLPSSLTRRSIPRLCSLIDPPYRARDGCSPPALDAPEAAGPPA